VSRKWKPAFVAVALLVTTVMAITSVDYGISQDESAHRVHGQILLDYFRGVSDRALWEPLNADGSFPANAGGYTAFDDPAWRGLNIYAGTFDLLCEAVYRYVPTGLGPYEVRHLLGGLLGALAIVMTGQLAHALSGSWATGTLALLFAALTPRLVGHAMNNPKDAPFAALYICALVQLLAVARDLPRVRLWRALLLAITMAVATDVRIAGLLLLVYTGLVLGGWAVHGRWRSTVSTSDAVHVGAWAAGITALAYLLVSPLWPYAHQAPLTTPLRVLGLVSHFEFFHPYALFAGRWITAAETPWFYLPVWLGITLPLFVPIGLCGLWRWSWPLAFVAFAAVFPVVHIIATRAVVYDEARHVLFVIPPLLALAAVGWQPLLRSPLARWAHPIPSLVLLGTLLDPLTWAIRNHPFEGLYFSPVIGGIQGAWGRFEIDYWSISQRAAVEWLAAHARPEPGRLVRVRAYYGDPECSSYYLARHPGFTFVVAPDASDAWDFHILMPAAAKSVPNLLTNWPPRGTVHQITADGVALNAIIENPRSTVRLDDDSDPSRMR
jgi:hypothetical protein